jgi:hypothetical protein
LQDAIRKPVDLAKPVERYLGRTLLCIPDDGRLCQHLATNGYVPELGARSLRTFVDEAVSQPLETDYFHVDELVTEDVNRGPFQEYEVQLNAVAEDVEEISVFRKDVKEGPVVFWEVRGEGEGE